MNNIEKLLVDLAKSITDGAIHVTGNFSIDVRHDVMEDISASDALKRPPDCVCIDASLECRRADE